MSRSRFSTGGMLALAAAAGLGLAGCHSGSSAASSPATASTTAAASTAATATSATSAPASSPAASTSTGLTVSGGNVSYFPAAVGDTWVYQISTSAGDVGTTTNRVTAVTPTAGGNLVTESDSETLAGVPQTHTYQYVIHSDGSITVPVSSTDAGVTVKSGQLIWPDSAQLAAGQATTATLVFTATDSGKTTTYSETATIKGEGTQTVTVPAGSYSATAIGEVMSGKVLGVAVKTDVETWVATGVGPVKETVSSGEGSYVLTITEVLKSFTKG
jgi:hypothetical protein